MTQYKSFAIILFLLLLSACAAPRVVNVSGKVTPKNNLVGGVSYTANIPTATAKYTKDIIAENVRDVANRDSITLDENFRRINRAAIAFAVDPFASGYDFYVRYGIINRLDAGYKLAGKAHVFSAQYQFLGTTGSIGTGEVRNQLYASIGFQYSFQSYKLPGILEDLQGRLGYEFKRKDILVPLIFSYSLGREEEYGSIAFGVAYSYTFLRYTTLPDRVFNDNNMPVFGVKNKQGFSAVGGFINAKLGYRYVYFVPALALYSQQYGTYKLLGGEEFSFKGFTFIPSLSLQFRLGK